MNTTTDKLPGVAWIARRQARSAESWPVTS
jgi:hypothetical protein